MLASSEGRWEEHQRNERPRRHCYADPRPSLCIYEKNVRLSSALVCFHCFCWPSRSFPAPFSASCYFSVLLLVLSRDDRPQVQVLDANDDEDHKHDEGKDDSHRVQACRNSDAALWDLHL